MNWRLRKDAAGSGANGDLNAHHVDMARFLVGEIGEVVGMQKTFITERPAEGRSAGLTATAGEGTEKVTVDDATLFLAKFASGALGSFEATRMAPGRKNYNRVEINGSRGSLVFNFEEMNVLRVLQLRRPARPARLPPDHGDRGRAPVRRRRGGRRATCWATSTRSSTPCTS